MYVTELQNNSIGPDGILTKLDRIQAALKYLRRDIDQFRKSEEVVVVLDRLALWKMSFRSNKIIKMKEKAAREVDTTTDDLKAIELLIHSPVAFEKVTKIIEVTNPSDEDSNFLSTFIFLCLGYKNFQRPGPAINMTPKEADEAVYVKSDGEEDKLKILVSKHKTARSYGPAILYLSQDDATMFIHYRDNVRPQIPTSSQCDVFLVRANGMTYAKNYARYVGLYSKAIGLKDKPPSLTTTRKSGATAGKSCLSNKEMEELSRHMMHSSFTSERYYRNLQLEKESLQTFEKIQKISSK